MKKGFGKGFATGILVTALTVGLGVSALAATRTITVDDNIRVTINGAMFTPKNEQGKEVPLFAPFVPAPPSQKEPMGPGMVFLMVVLGVIAALVILSLF